ncbi:MAG: hypothetical protein ACE5KO_03195 [Candidatus Bathyarchaeia archaeon]
MRFKAISRQPLQGDYFSTQDGTIFTVIGSAHPSDSIISTPKHRQSEHTNDPKTHHKFQSLVEAYEILKRTHPEFLVFDHIFDCEVCRVPRSEVSEYWQPEMRTRSLLATENPDPIQKEAIELLELFRSACGIPLESIGITGSLLPGVHSADSDFDLIFYGASICRRTYSRIGQLLDSNKGSLRRYLDVDLRRQFELQKRDTRWSFEDFSRCQVNRNLQGKFKERDFFLRMLRPPEIEEEAYGERIYSNVGRATITGVVTSDDDIIFTPCIYPLEKVKSQGSSLEISEVVSFRGRFCELVKKGESLLACGKIESVKSQGDIHFRLLVGSDPRDILVRAK